MPLRRKGTSAIPLVVLWDVGRAVTAFRSVPGTGIADADRDGTWLQPYRDDADGSGSSSVQTSKPGCYAMKAKACACNLNLLGASTQSETRTACVYIPGKQVEKVTSDTVAYCSIFVCLW